MQVKLLEKKKSNACPLPGVRLRIDKETARKMQGKICDLEEREIMNLAFEGTRAPDAWHCGPFEGCAGGRGSRHYNWAIATRHVWRTKHVFSSWADTIFNPIFARNRVISSVIQLIRYESHRS